MKEHTMKTERLQADRAGIDRAAALLAAGELVAIPTETVYGLAANALDGDAVKRIFAAKGRPQDNPLIVHIASEDALQSLVSHVPDSAKLLARAFWPGPLTMILPKAACIPEEVSAGLDTVAVRLPAHTVAQAVIKAAGVPLAAPSANRSGLPSPTAAEHVLQDLDGKIAAILDGGACKVGVESTVVTLCGEHPVLLRPGGITLEQLRAVLPDITVDAAVEHQMEAGQRAASPGMKYKHYAPKTEITVVKGGINEFVEYLKTQQDGTCGVLCFDGEEEHFSCPCVSYGAKDNPKAQARRLFDALREVDALGVKRVFARCPATCGLGLAVYNRLIRAAAFHLIETGGTEPRRGLLIGLTGPTGAGKSTAARACAQAGCAVIDADRVARQVTEAGSETLCRLAGAFGKDILNTDGSLNRTLLAARAFTGEEERRTLNAITHPAVMARIQKQTEEFFVLGVDIIVLDAPLLIESGAHRLCDAVISVLAPQEVRKARIMARDALSEEAALRRMSAQRDDTFYAAHSDYILRNEHSDEALFRDTLAVIDSIKEAFYEKKVTLGD